MNIIDTCKKYIILLPFFIVSAKLNYFLHIYGSAHSGLLKNGDNYG